MNVDSGHQTSAATTGRRARAAWRALGALAAAGILVLGVLSAIAALSHRTERTHATFPGGVRLVDVRSSGGSIRVIGAKGPETTVDAVVDLGLERPAHSQELQGDRLVIRNAPCRLLAGAFCSVDYTIHVPRGVRVEAASSGGDVEVSDVEGSVDLSSSGGDVELGGATAQEVRVRSSGGDVEARGLVGASVDAASSGGDVTLSFVAPPERVVAYSSGGSVLIEVPNTADAYRIQAASTGGEAHTPVRTDPASPRLIRATSSGGPTTIRYGD